MSTPDYKKRWRERNPEKVREENKRRRAYKRRWESGKCPQCGGILGSAQRSKRCGKCELQAKKRAGKDTAIRFIALRKEGLLNSEIAAKCGTTQQSVASTLYLAPRRYGLDVPRSPYFKASA